MFAVGCVGPLLNVRQRTVKIYVKVDIGIHNHTGSEITP